MEDAIGQVAGNKLLQVKAQMAEVRELLQKETDEAMRKKLRLKLMELDTYYNILAEKARRSGF